MSTLTTLLDRLIDYAGLFPPAELAMRPAVENYRQYIGSENRSLLGRLIVPAARLPEFEAALADLLGPLNEERPWQVSALIGPSTPADRFQADLSAIEQFNRRQNSLAHPHAIVDTIEGKASSGQEIICAAEQVPRSLVAFLEIPIGPELDQLLNELQRVQSKREMLAKIRTGGIVPEAIPTADRVAAFIAGCAARDLGFKATAGLHHPIRARYPLTYKADAPSAVMYGFFNVFTAACAAFDDPRNTQRIAAILTESDIKQFRWNEQEFGWRGESWPIGLVRRVRQRAVSFGSCSFREPVDDLREFKLLP